MKIESVHIRNFRSIKDRNIILDDYTSFVGENGSGKSNILNALNIFFGGPDIPGLNTRNLRKEDFYNANTEDPIEVKLTFIDLSEEAKNDFSHYVRQDKLIVYIKAIFHEENQTVEIKQYGHRLGIRDFAHFFQKEKENGKVEELRKEYEKIRKK